ncbi:STP4 [Candida margitis]|uniref:STP4 n=1 Tax=Candida margitis TaxID=1775924 RepID=UPI0022262092|nr:STP4 [Candida margitis]KAI5954014.1 STP4 [Candida margitis]
MLTTAQPPSLYSHNYNNYNTSTPLMNNTTTRSSLMQYSLQPHSQQVQPLVVQKHPQPTSPLHSPSPTVVPSSNNLPHSSVILPSIHSLNIPTFPHSKEEVHVNRSSNIRSPPLLIPNADNITESTRASSCYSYSSDTPSVAPPSNQPTTSTSTATATFNYTHAPVIASPYVPTVAPLKHQESPASPASLPSSDHEEFADHESSASLSPTQSKKNWKPRKKRQCPECKLYFSNLATHKSTHLKPTNRPHICEYCQRGFARPNDLFRHTKCHWKEIGSDKGQFKCPFKNISLSSSATTSPNEDSTVSTASANDNCCHSTGIFSRCDTFKNHLKAIHFQYPYGTKKDQRNKVAGKCRMCFKEFENVDDWIHNHIETDSCPYALNKMKRD